MCGMNPKTLRVFTLMVAASSAPAQTCPDLKAEIARFQQTLASEQASLNNCNNHLGTCTPGQISGIQQAIEIAQQELSLDQAKLFTVCNPPPPPNFDHGSLRGIEVVPAIQDVANTVRLTAGKAAFVGVYLDKTNGARALTATLQAKRGSTVVSLTPLAGITVDATENLGVRRKNFIKSLNYQLPASMISSGTTILTIGTPTDTSSANKKIICDTCSNPTQVTFFNLPPIIIRAIGLTYPFPSPPAAPTRVDAPRALDFTLLKSWVTRAYPAALVIFSKGTAALNFTLFTGSGTG